MCANLGLLGRQLSIPAMIGVEQLENEWGTAWRPQKHQRVEFCRRKVIWDEMRRLVASGLSEDQAIEHLEEMRGTSSMNVLRERVEAQRKAREGLLQALLISCTLVSHIMVSFTIIAVNTIQCDQPTYC